MTDNHGAIRLGLLKPFKARNTAALTLKRGSDNTRST